MAAFWRLRTARTDSRMRHFAEQKRLPCRLGTNIFSQSDEAHLIFALGLLFMACNCKRLYFACQGKSYAATNGRHCWGFGAFAQTLTGVCK